MTIDLVEPDDHAKAMTLEAWKRAQKREDVVKREVQGSEPVQRKEVGVSDAVPYDREVLVTVLVYHYRNDNSSCGCGWAELGRSHPEHVANVYEQSIRAREGV